MINMMYLVLTALLALNVSKEILKSFHMMEQSFVAASSNYDAKNALVMKAFEQSNTQDPVKTKPFYDRAKQARKISSVFIAKMAKIKTELEENAKGRKPKEAGELVGDLVSPDDIENHANYFMPTADGGKGHGTEVQKLINDTRIQLLTLLKKDANFDINEKLYKEASASALLEANDPTEKVNGVRKTWVTAYLEHSPLAGVMALFAKIENDAKALETDVLSKLQTGITANDITFDQLQAKVISSSSYVMTGTPYEADVILVASNSTTKQKIIVNGKELPVEAGVGKFSAVHSDVGIKSFSGNIMVMENGKEKPYPFEATYQTFKPAATISADKMNVLYVGLNNPISVSVPGFPASAVSASISGGWKLKNRKGNTYQATGGRGVREVTVSAVVKTEKGNKSMGSQKYRIRPVPNPVAKIGQLDGSRPSTAGIIRAQRSVFASLGEGFAFEGVKFKVTKYTLVVSTKKGTRTKSFKGSSFSAAAGLLGGIRRGDMVIVTGITCTGPGGTKKIPGVTVQVQ
jgi:gliding motility-associated protein GldM